MVHLFASDIEAWTFYLVYSLWLLSEVVGAGVIPRLRRRGTQIKRKDNSSLLVDFLPFYRHLMYLL